MDESGNCVRLRVNKFIGPKTNEADLSDELDQDNIKNNYSSTLQEKSSPTSHETENYTEQEESESGNELELISDEEIEKANNYVENLEHTENCKVQDVSISSSDEETDLHGKRIKKTKGKLSKGALATFSINKAEDIEAVLSSSPLDLEKLRQLAKEEGGLVTDEIRKRAWPQLMQVDKSEVSSQPMTEDIKLHKEYNQVVMDVNRTLKRFPPGIDEAYRYVLMDQLTTLIIRVLQKHPHLHYYQGYHDVAITFLLVVGESAAFELVEQLSITHLQEFMRPSMERTTYYLTYLYPVLKRADRPLHDFLVKSCVGTVFCLPWLITWYAHTLSDYRNVVRLYDFFLATPYLTPMYIAVAIVLHRKEAILAEECDMAMQHFVLSQVPDTLPFEALLKKASELYSLYPPDDMRDEVDVIIRQKALAEEEEKKRLQERRSKAISRKSTSGVGGIVASVCTKFYLSPTQKRYFKVLVFACTATLATGLFGYYSNSNYLKPYLPWS